VNAFAATAAAAPFRFTSRGLYPNMTTSILIGTPYHFYLTTFDGNSFTNTVDLPQDGVPSWSAFQAPNKVWSVDEWGDQTRLYTVDPASQTIELVISESGSPGIVSLELNKEGTRMVGAGYGAGTVDVWNIENDGLELITTWATDAELGPNEERQDQPHPHQIVLDNSGRYFTVNDLGTDTITLLDSQDDTWTPATEVRVEPAGCGPRHGVYYPAGAEVATHYLLVCEMLNLVNVYSLEYGTDGIAFTPVQSISTSAQDLPATAKAAEIILKGNDVYVSNRLIGTPSDTVAHFKVSTNGTAPLTLQAEVPSGGTTPRHMSLTADGTVLLVGNQDGESGLVALQRDTTTGALMSTPIAQIPLSTFGEGESPGPQFVAEIPF
jgi:6-phosphogluconolactonase (cycloisomerase 2 family)